jgi:hypothetical protein
VGRSGGARQQPVEDCSAVDGSIIAQTKSRLTISPILWLLREETVAIIAAPWLLQPDSSRNRDKNRVKTLVETRYRSSVSPSFIEEMTRGGTNQGVSRQKLASYRSYHLQHHKFTQQPEDPDLSLSAPFPITKESYTRKAIRDLIPDFGMINR